MASKAQANQALGSHTKKAYTFDHFRSRYIVGNVASIIRGLGLRQLAIVRTLINRQPAFKGLLVSVIPITRFAPDRDEHARDKPIKDFTKRANAAPRNTGQADIAVTFACTNGPAARCFSRPGQLTRSARLGGAPSQTRMLLRCHGRICSAAVLRSTSVHPRFQRNLLAGLCPTKLTHPGIARGLPY